MKCIICSSASRRHNDKDAIQVDAQGLKSNPSDCVYCGTCAGICPAEAVELIDKTMSVDDVSARRLETYNLTVKIGG